MYRAHCTLRTIAVAFVVAMPGCSTDEEPPLDTCSGAESAAEPPSAPIGYKTEHLEIHVGEGRFVCAGTAADYERFFQGVEDRLLVEHDVTVPVFVLESVSEYCPPPATGCVRPDGVVFSLPGSTYHELTHAVACDWGLISTPALTEGLAVAQDVVPLSGQQDPYSYISLDRSEIRPYYSPSGHFVRWLLEEYGPEKLRRAYIESPSSGGPEVLDVLASVYETDVDALFASYEASAPHTWVPHDQCGGLPTLEPTGDVWEFAAMFDCDDVATLGPWERLASDTDLIPGMASSMYQSFLLEVTAPGVYTFERDLDTGVWLERCINKIGLDETEAEELWFAEPLFPSLQGISEVELDVGVYRVDVLRAHGDPQLVELRIEPPA